MQVGPSRSHQSLLGGVGVGVGVGLGRCGVGGCTEGEWFVRDESIAVEHTPTRLSVHNDWDTAGQLDRTITTL